jgi:SNF2 family DNA or RNA helicase
LALRSLQRLAGSSPWALAPSLEKAGWTDLARLADKIDATEKARVLIELLRRHRAAGEKVVVFTAFRHTLGFLADLAATAGLPAAIYHGALSRRDKEEAIRSFRDELPVLLTTEAAGEGRNLQFCHVMVNFDLPWNPMQIEQRLGRIHRIGQDHEVLLTNLVTRGTVEERILGVLEAKINLFELVVGELDMILGRIEEDFDFERFVFDTHVASRDDAEFQARLESLGNDLLRARQDYLAGRGRTDQLIAPTEP